MHGGIIGITQVNSYIIGNGSATTMNLSASGAIWCARHVAQTTKDVKAIKVSWSTVTTPGQVKVRYETIDGTTGLPTNALYDANAELTAQTPVVGVQTFTFATTPTAGRTVGSAYGLVIETTSAGTAHTLYSHLVPSYTNSFLPSAQLSHVSSRASIAEITPSIPLAVLIMEDDTEEIVALSPYRGTRVSNPIYGTLGVGMLITIDKSQILRSVSAQFLRTATPSGDLRMQLFSGASVVSGSTVTVDKDWLLAQTTNSREVDFMFSSLLLLDVGTYRIMFDSAACDSSNYFRLYSLPFMSANAVQNNFRLTTCPDIGSPSFTDSTTDDVPVHLNLDSVPACAGGTTPAYSIGGMQTRRS